MPVRFCTVNVVLGRGLQERVCDRREVSQHIYGQKRRNGLRNICKSLQATLKELYPLFYQLHVRILVEKLTKETLCWRLFVVVSWMVPRVVVLMLVGWMPARLGLASSYLTCEKSNLALEQANLFFEESETCFHGTV